MEHHGREVRQRGEEHQGRDSDGGWLTCAERSEGGEAKVAMTVVAWDEGPWTGLKHDIREVRVGSGARADTAEHHGVIIPPLVVSTGVERVAEGREARPGAGGNPRAVLAGGGA